MNDLGTLSVQFLKGVGPKKAGILAKYGICSIEDLLYFFPRRYEDRTHITPVSEIREGQVVLLKVKVLALKARRTFSARSMSIIEVLTGDDTGAVVCVWFNQGYLKGYFKPGREMFLYGKVDRYSGRLQMSAPDFEFLDDEQGEGEEPKNNFDELLSAGRIVPVYSLPEGFSQRSFRKLIRRALDEHLSKITDCLPFFIRDKHNLLNLAKSLREIHFPENADLQAQAYTRLAFEEFFLFQLPIVLRKMRKKEEPGIAHAMEGEFLTRVISSLPFRLTVSQQKVFEEIKSDMRKPMAMHRLLQGDVGSGKTVIATLASIAVVQGGYQAAFVVPTEILAKQHYEKISAQVAGLGNLNKTINVALLTGGTNPKSKIKVMNDIKEGKIDMVIGTHTLFTENVQFRNLGFVVIDEQHKFGVGQRALLPQKGLNPDILIMTATPIPRTLAITIYGDLDLSILNELPPGRGTITTCSFPENQVFRAYEIVKNQLKSGNQAYIVYPVIEESFAFDIAGAKDMFERLKTGIFKGVSIGLIHGRLKAKEQSEIMTKFRNKEISILVATTILEVGIDVPTATCMVIYNAERFGLSQLHQLRGRVGRGGNDSFCLLISDQQTEDAQRRIEAMVKYSDGFHIAEEDLKIRGPGEFFGARQHGLSDLKIGNPLRQLHLLKLAREDATMLLKNDPMCRERTNILVKQKLLQRFPEYEKFVAVG